MPCCKRCHVQHHDMLKLASTVNYATNATQLCDSLNLMLPFEAIAVKCEDIAMTMVTVTQESRRRKIIVHLVLSLPSDSSSEPPLIPPLIKSNFCLLRCCIT